MAEEEEFDPTDPPAVAALLPVYRSLYRDFIDLSTAVEYSSLDTRELKLGRDGFTYGETNLASVWRLWSATDLGQYSCCCATTGGATTSREERPGKIGAGGLAHVIACNGRTGWAFSDDVSRHRRRCALCGRRVFGAAIVDLGSGIGNVVAATALIEASGALGDGQRIGSVIGVELLPRLHAAGEAAVARLRSHWADASASSAAATMPTMPAARRALPPCELQLGNLLEFRLEDTDVVYMASTVFEDHTVRQFASRAAEALRPGSRVVTLASPLAHEAFAVERVVPCVNSWGEEDAYVNVRVAW